MQMRSMPLTLLLPSARLYVQCIDILHPSSGAATLLRDIAMDTVPQSLAPVKTDLIDPENTETYHQTTVDPRLVQRRHPQTHVAARAIGGFA